MRIAATTYATRFVMPSSSSFEAGGTVPIQRGPPQENGQRLVGSLAARTSQRARLRHHDEARAVTPAEDFREVGLLGVRRRDEEVAGRGRARVVHVLVHALREPRRAEDRAVVTEIDLVPRAVVPAIPRREVRAAAELSLRGLRQLVVELHL